MQRHNEIGRPQITSAIIVHVSQISNQRPFPFRCNDIRADITGITVLMG